MGQLCSTLISIKRFVSFPFNESQEQPDLHLPLNLSPPELKDRGGLSGLISIGVLLLLVIGLLPCVVRFVMGRLAVLRQDVHGLKLHYQALKNNKKGGNVVAPKL